MSVLGIIAEYNPFHLGHKYQLEKSKKITNSRFSVAFISGSFVQRGEPALVDKWSRAKMAVDCGVDLVFELPTFFSSQTAEIFAYNSIRLMDLTNSIDYLSFGSESGNLAELNSIAKILSNMPRELEFLIEEYINKNYSYPKARSLALIRFLSDDNIGLILRKSNNILGVEYLKALIQLNSQIKPITIKRIGSDYQSLDLKDSLASASAIRGFILKNKIYVTRNYLPSCVYENLLYQTKFNKLTKYEDILFYLLQNNDSFNIFDLDTNLYNRMKKSMDKSENLNELINLSISTNYTRSRVQRALIHILLNLKKKDFQLLHNSFPNYLRLLASNTNGFKIINKIKKNSNLTIITKFNEAKKIKDESILKSLSYDKKATDLYYLTLNKKINMDYLNSPYIKKT